MKSKIFCFTFFLLGFGINTMYSQKQLKKAEMYTQDASYQLAAEQYTEYLKENEKDYSVIALLAKNYVMAGDLSNADLWYSKIPSNAAVEPSTFKDHGDVLKKMGSYKDAIAKYKIYANYNPTLGDVQVKNCEYALTLVKKAPTKGVLVLPSNSNVSDYGLTFYKNMPVFTSFRQDITLTAFEKELNGTSGGQRTYIYNTEKNRLLFVKGPNEKMTGIGPISFSQDNKKCAIIDSNTKDIGPFIQYPKSSRLLIAEVNDNGEMTSFKPFTHNEVGSSINSAFLAFEGSVVYFSSDRKGGYGGFDIYVSSYQNGEWALPVNLGNTINSPGNEITPWLQDNQLYFASDYHTGLGGYDIFVSKVQSGLWQMPENPGYGVNSSGDDYFPAVSPIGEFYLTSNRLGGKGLNDIYKTEDIAPPVAELAETEVPKAISLEALASATQKPSTILAKSDDVSMVKQNRDVAFHLPEFDSGKVGSNATNPDANMVGAYRVALTEFIPNTEVFFIQLASMSSSKPNFEKFKPLLKFGNIYKMLNDKSVKVRLGYFNDRKEAEEILSKVKQNGYKDAFISQEVLNTARMELVLTSTDENSFSDKGNFNTKNPDVEKNFKSLSKYKVRLASYEDPIWFEVNKVKDLGRIEQWTKGGWTIFILAGYKDLEEAKQAQIQASNRGYKTAEVVIDNGGILERLKQN